MAGPSKEETLRKELEKALADNVLTDDEDKYFEERSKELGIHRQFVDDIIREHCRKQLAP